MTNFNYIGEFYGDDGARKNDGICYGCGLVGQGEIGFGLDLRGYSSPTRNTARE